MNPDIFTYVLIHVESMAVTAQEDMTKDEAVRRNLQLTRKGIKKHEWRRVDDSDRPAPHYYHPDQLTKQ